MRSSFGNPAFGAVQLKLNMSPLWVQCLRDKGTWIGDQQTGYCVMPATGLAAIPTYAYVIGGVGVVGAIYWFFLR